MQAATRGRCLFPIQLRYLQPPGREACSSVWAPTEGKCKHAEGLRLLLLLLAFGGQSLPLVHHDLALVGQSLPGLAIAHEVVQRHGGHIRVDTALGVGTTFCVVLKAADAAKAAKPESYSTAA